ncbi:MAG: hypothetical protein LAQ30_19555, partial [Acidobacteriia bacterium]|nr:hypothetical protein [Terriglobia bacterium]
DRQSQQRVPHIIPNPFDNTLLIQGTPQEWEQISNLLEQLDVPPRQVLIEAKIFEVDLNGAFASGVSAYLNKIGDSSAGGSTANLARTLLGSSTSTGLNLTAASHVVHFDRWWNPAVENQATDRAFRIGQTKNVLVHKFVCRGTVEEKIDQLMEAKSRLAKDLLEGGAEQLLTELKDEELLRLVALDLHKALEEA